MSITVILMTALVKSVDTLGSAQFEMVLTSIVKLSPELKAHAMRFSHGTAVVVGVVVVVAGAAVVVVVVVVGSGLVSA